MQDKMDFMKQALLLAEKSFEAGETPIGCVIVKDNGIVGQGYNLRNTEGNALSHAEIKAIHEACQRLGDWRLEDCVLYVTLEPCPMCAGAIVQARIPKVVIGAMNPKAGCAGSVLNLLQQPGFNHRVEIESGVLEEESRMLLKRFFRDLRIQKNTSGYKGDLGEETS